MIAAGRDVNFVLTGITTARPGPIYVSLPELPSGYRPRETDLKALKAALLDSGHNIGLLGMAGVGKTVLATALVHEPDVRQAFTYGIIWLRFGRAADALAKLTVLSRAVTGQAAGYTTAAEAGADLGRLLGDRSLLVVLDDIWEPAVVDEWLALGCRLLITTRHQAVLSRARAFAHPVGLLDAAASRAMFTEASAMPDLPDEADAVIRECDGLPLALVAAGGMVRRAGFAYTRNAFARARLDVLKTTWLPDSEQQNLAVVLAASVQALPEPARGCFLECAVWPEDVSVPVAALGLFWSARVPDEFDWQPIEDELVDASVMQRDSRGALRLHDLYHDYLRHLAGDKLAAMHGALIDRCVRLGESGPTWLDRSAWVLEHLPWHFVQAGRVGEATALQFDFDWLATKVAAYGVQPLIADTRLVQDAELERLGHAFRLSAHILARDPTQLAAQLLGRLLGAEEPRIQGLLKEATEARRNDTWLRPLSASLTQPGGPLVRTLSGRGDWLVSVAASRDGRFTVTASASPLKAASVLEAWDLQAGVVTRSLDIDQRRITQVTVTSDGRLALAATERAVSLFVRPFVDNAKDAEPTGVVMIWDIDANTTRRVEVGHSQGVNAVAVTPDDRIAVSGAADGTLIAWEITTGDPLRTFIGHTGPVEAVAITPNGQFVVSAGGKGDPILRVWELNSGLQQRTLAGHAGGLTAVTVSPDSRLAISASADRTLKIWNLATGVVLRTLEGHTDPIHDVAVSPDGRMIFSAAGDVVYSEDNTIRVWDLASGRLVHTLTGHGHRVSAIAVLSDNRSLLSVSLDGTMRLWDLASKNDPSTTRHDDDVNAVAVTSDGNFAVSASNDKTLKVWDPQTGTLIRTLAGHTSSVGRLALTADSRRAVSASGNYAKAAPCELIVWDLRTGKASLTIDAQASYVRALAITSDGRRAIWAGGDADVKVCDLDQAAEIRHLGGHKGQISALAVTRDSQLVLSGAEDRTVRVWQLESGQMVRELHGHGGGVTSIALTPDDRFAISASSDATVKVWDLVDGKGIQTLAGHKTIVSDVTVSPNGKFAVSSSGDGVLMVWDTARWGLISTLRGHTAAIYDQAFTDDSRLLVSASVDNTIRVWHVAEGLLAATFWAEGGINACACAPDCRTFLAGDRSGGVHFLRLEQPEDRH